MSFIKRIENEKQNKKKNDVKIEQTKTKPVSISTNLQIRQLVQYMTMCFIIRISILDSFNTDNSIGIFIEQEKNPK
jgi:hypothetical protein